MDDGFYIGRVVSVGEQIGGRNLKRRETGATVVYSIQDEETGAVHEVSQAENDITLLERGPETLRTRKIGGADRPSRPTRGRLTPAICRV